MILRAALGLMLCLFFVLPAKADSAGVIAVRGIDVDVTGGQCGGRARTGGPSGPAQGLASGSPDAGARRRCRPAAAAQRQPDHRSRCRLRGRIRTDLHRALYRQACLPLSRSMPWAICCSRMGSPPPRARARRCWSCPCSSPGARTCCGTMAMPGAMPGRPIRPSGGLVEVMVPKGDATDAAAITGDQAAAGDMAKIQALAAQYGVGDVAVVIAQPDACPGRLPSA